LLWPLWHPETTFYGSWSTNLTPFLIPMLSRSNLFMMAESEIAPRIVGAGNSHFAVLRRDGTVWSWGNGGSGQLGDGDWTNTATPVQAAGLSNVVAIIVPPAGDYTLALDAHGKVWSWGANGNGQLGRHDSLYENEDSSAIVPGLSNIVAIAGGSGHAIALRSDGTVWAWGDNAYGDLGDGSGTQRDYAAPVPGLTNAIAITSGECQCFTICAKGTVLGWGLNEDWELGIGNADDQSEPVLVSSLTNAVALSGGLFHSIALLSNGSIKAWGANYFGEIGNISSSTPVSVTGLSNITSIACGAVHNLFINTNGNIFAWGYDADGEFGDGGADSGSTAPYFLGTVSNVTAIGGGYSSSIVSVGNGNIYTFGQSYEYEPVPTLTDIYTNYSSDGSGLPDWWEKKYFGHLGLDPNSDPVGDGWSLLQDYEQGYNPTNFVTPPAITGLTVTATNAADGIQLTWSAEIPTPLHYAIYRIDYDYNAWQYGPSNQIGEVNGDITTFTDNGSVPGGDQNSIYEAVGIYGGGTSDFSAEAYFNGILPPTLSDDIPFNADLVRNGTGRWQLMFSGIPNGIQTIRLLSYLGSGQINATADISVSNIVDGAYGIPDSDVLNYLGTTIYVQGVGPNGLPGQEIYAGVVSTDAPYFVNGQQHMEQNLNFLIRAASIYSTFGDLINEAPQKQRHRLSLGSDCD
jgi:alpha-tubulin suppressor-like RCC1 family protein